MVKIRRIIFWAHLTAGVTAGLVIFMMAVTGMSLAFETQITEWAEQDLRSVTLPANPTPMPFDQMLDKVRRQNPGAEPSTLTLNSRPSASVLVSLASREVVSLNPYTGETLGRGSRMRAWLQKIEGWHRWLGASLEHRTAGRAITGAADLFLLGLVASGCYLWWPRNWNWRALRPSLWFVGGLRGRVREWNWHNVVGCWCAPALMAITMTGAIMAYPWANNLLFTLTNSPLPAVSPSNQAGREGGPRKESGVSASEREHSPLASVDLLVMKARQQAPDWRIITLRLPQNFGPPAVVTIQETETRLSSARLTLDSHTGEIRQWEPFADRSLGGRLRVWTRFLHTGEAGGVAGQAIAALASAGGAVLVATGLAMALRRFWSGKSAGPPPKRNIVSS